MVTLLDLFSENDQIKKWHQNLTDKKRQLMLGLSTSTKALAIASSLRQEDKIVLLTSTYGEAEGLVSDLISVLGEELVYPFLVDDSPMVEFLMSSQEKIISRVEALIWRLESKVCILWINSGSPCGGRKPNQSKLFFSVISRSS